MVVGRVMIDDKLSLFLSLIHQRAGLVSTSLSVSDRLDVCSNRILWKVRLIGKSQWSAMGGGMADKLVSSRCSLL